MAKVRKIALNSAVQSNCNMSTPGLIKRIQPSRRESSMKPLEAYLLPEFSFHEACLLTVVLTSSSLPDLHIPPEPTPQDELRKRSPEDAALIVRSIKKGVERFLARLNNLELSDFWDLDDLRPKLENLNEQQYIALYFALKKYFWELEKHSTQAEALCDAGFFSKEKLPFAQKVEASDRRRRQLHVASLPKRDEDKGN